MNTGKESDSIELSPEEKAGLLSAARLADLQMKAWIKENGGIAVGEDRNDVHKDKPL